MDLHRKAGSMKRLTVGIGAGLMVIGAICAFMLISGRTHVIPFTNAPSEALNKPVKGKLAFEVKKDDVPEIPDKMTVYRFEPMFTGKADIQQLASKLGIEAEVKPGNVGGKGGDYYSARDGEVGLGIGITYMIDSQTLHMQVHPKIDAVNPDLPSREDSPRIAADALKRIGLYPEEAYHSGFVRDLVSYSDGKGQWTRHEPIRHVEFSRKLDGFPVVGPGMRILVSLGTDGELIGISSTIRKLVPYREYRTKSMEEALSDAQKGKNTMNLSPDTTNPRVNRVELLYYADPADEESRFLQPVFALTGPGASIYVPAIK